MKKIEHTRILASLSSSGKILRSSIQEAVSLLQNGEVVALPSETVYGLAANIFFEDAVRSIFAIKGRPSDNPLIVHVADVENVRPLVSELSPLAEALFRYFSPGPLTLILPKSEKVSSYVTAGRQDVAIRIPSHPVFRAVLREGLALAAPSANASGRPSPTKAQHVYDDLKGKLQLILDGGEASIGLESTVLRILEEEVSLEILRPGFLTKEDFEFFLAEHPSFSHYQVHYYQDKYLKEKTREKKSFSKFFEKVKSKEITSISQDQSLENSLEKPKSKEVFTEHSSKQVSPPSPGMKYRHYAPSCPVLLYNFPLCSQEDSACFFKKLKIELRASLQEFYSKSHAQHQSFQLPRSSRKISADETDKGKASSSIEGKSQSQQKEESSGCYQACKKDKNDAQSAPFCLGLFLPFPLTEEEKADLERACKELGTKFSSIQAEQETPFLPKLAFHYFIADTSTPEQRPSYASKPATSQTIKATTRAKKKEQALDLSPLHRAEHFLFTALRQLEQEGAELILVPCFDLLVYPKARAYQNRVERAIEE